MQKADMMADRPRVLVYRGDTVESRHRVSFAVADAAGGIVQSRGKTDRPVFPRSAIKMLQAIPLMETGAADRFSLTPAELALACASHNGEPHHVDTVASWLQKLDLSADDLECGAHLPSHALSARDLIGTGRPPTCLHNNCSGKHAGMLTLAKHLGVETSGYIRPDHPVQKLIGEALVALTGWSLSSAPAIDGCGIPAFAIPLKALAVAMARFASPVGLGSSRETACRRLAWAMMHHPEKVAGEGRPCTSIMRAVPELVVKTGAEGVYTAAWPKQGIGLALKVEDGSTRASCVALMALLERLGAVEGKARAVLKEIARPTIRNHAGTVVGHIEPDAIWPDFPVLEAASGVE